MSLRTVSWRQLFLCGEVVGFVLAWVVGLLVALQTRNTDRTIATAEQLASANGATEVRTLRPFLP
jgi:hypothetical protein